VKVMPQDSGPRLQGITPQSDLFMLAHMGAPRINGKKLTLTVTGLVRDSDRPKGKTHTVGFAIRFASCSSVYRSR
jgi:hypothetical protein